MVDASYPAPAPVTKATLPSSRTACPAGLGGRALARATIFSKSADLEEYSGLEKSVISLHLSSMAPGVMAASGLRSAPEARCQRNLWRAPWLISNRLPDSFLFEGCTSMATALAMLSISEVGIPYIHPAVAGGASTEAKMLYLAPSRAMVWMKPS